MFDIHSTVDFLVLISNGIHFEMDSKAFFSIKNNIVFESSNGDCSRFSPQREGDEKKSN